MPGCRRPTRPLLWPTGCGRRCRRRVGPVEPAGLEAGPRGGSVRRGSGPMWPARCGPARRKWTRPMCAGQAKRDSAGGMRTRPGERGLAGEMWTGPGERGDFRCSSALSARLMPDFDIDRAESRKARRKRHISIIEESIIPQIASKTLSKVGSGRDGRAGPTTGSHSSGAHSAGAAAGTTSGHTESGNKSCGCRACGEARHAARPLSIAPAYSTVTSVPIGSMPNTTCAFEMGSSTQPLLCGQP